MGILDRLLFWRKPEQPEYEITDCFGEPNSTEPSALQAAVTEDNSVHESCELPTSREEE